MRLAHVIGRVSFSDQVETYRGGRWLMVNPLTREELLHGAPYPLSPEWCMVVYDRLGATVGDVIGVIEGGEAAFPFPEPTPIDAYNACIFDRINYFPPSAAPEAATA